MGERGVINGNAGVGLAPYAPGTRVRVPPPAQPACICTPRWHCKVQAACKQKGC